MQGYQMKMELVHSDPLVWRRVVVPKGMSFADLHAVIQAVFGFHDRHLYLFQLVEQDIKVTNDEEAYQAHQEYKNNQEAFEKALGSLGTAFAQDQLKSMRTEVYKPESLYVDPYLADDARLTYFYDFRAGWEIFLSLEQVVADYVPAYPTLLAGSKAAPPEGVGGLKGFYEFLLVYNDPQHPDHSQARKWAEQRGFREYDPQYIQARLKAQ